MSRQLASFVSVLAVLLLGVTAGAMLAEAAILVPYWRSLAPADFFDWYAAHASLLVDFYSPLEIASATFFVYFKDANAGFSTRAISENSLPTALEAWSRWQWGRVGVGSAAFVASVLAIRTGTSTDRT